MRGPRDVVAGCLTTGAADAVVLGASAFAGCAGCLLYTSDAADD